jgi:hypothetical protein
MNEDCTVIYNIAICFQTNSNMNEDFTVMYNIAICFQTNMNENFTVMYNIAICFQTNMNEDFAVMYNIAMFSVISSITLLCFQLQGEVDDCTCKVETLDSINNQKIFPRLQSLLSKDYFRYFKVMCRLVKISIYNYTID